MSDTTNNTEEIYAVVSESLYKYITSDNVGAIREIIKQGENITNTVKDLIEQNGNINEIQKKFGRNYKFVGAKEICSSAKCGSMNCLRFFIEEMKISPCSKAVSYAIENGKHQAALYLLRNNAPVKSDSLDILFNRYKHINDIPALTADEIQQYNELDIFISLDSRYTFYVRLIVALIQKYDLPLTGNHLQHMFQRLWTSWSTNNDNYTRAATDICYILRKYNIPIIGEAREYILSHCILMGINPKIKADDDSDSLENLECLINSPDKTLDIDIINKCIHWCHPDPHHSISEEKYQIIRRNFEKAVELYPLSLTDSYPYNATCPDTQLILEKGALSVGYIGFWLINCIRHRESNYSVIVNHLTTTNQWIKLNPFLIDDIVQESLITNLSIFDEVVQASNYQKKIRWVDLEKRYGKYRCQSSRKQIEKTPPKFINLIDLSPPTEKDYETKWIWAGVNINRKTFGTYIRSDYVEHSINSMFKDITTLDDIKDFRNVLDQIIYSVTDCYFDISDNVFYRDQQDCILWALDSDGKVYIKDDNQPYVKQYVAKSLPEFLSHIYDDNNTWLKKNKFIGC